MDHLEAIVKLDKVIHEEFISKIIPIINKEATSFMTVTTKNKIRTNERNVKGKNILPDSQTWKIIQEEITRLYIFYKAKFPLLESKELLQIDLLKYEVGHKYDVHCDTGHKVRRNISVIMNLNEEYKGGDLIFTDQKLNTIKKFNLKKGSIIFFPSNFLYPHGIEPITKGTRYSIVAWLQ